MGACTLGMNLSIHPLDLCPDHFQILLSAYLNNSCSYIFHILIHSWLWHIRRSIFQRISFPYCRILTLTHLTTLLGPPTTDTLLRLQYQPKLLIILIPLLNFHLCHPLRRLIPCTWTPLPQAPFYSISLEAYHAIVWCCTSSMLLSPTFPNSEFNLLKLFNDCISWAVSRSWFISHGFITPLDINVTPLPFNSSWH